MKTTTRYATVKQIPEIYPAFKKSYIRHLIFYAKEKGFEKCFHKIGKKILIDLDKFEKWIANKK